MVNESTYWQIEGDYFTFPENLKVVKSRLGNEIKTILSSIDNGTQIFLRGSLLEKEKPFKNADVDLFVIYDDNTQLNFLNEKLEQSYNYDIKLIKRGKRQNDFVYNALLQCRALQICGIKYNRTKVKADKKFAWEHWIQYCPVKLPNTINTSNRFSLIHFKLLTRCFGVISYLKIRKFTRDISECINIAKIEAQEYAETLVKLRYCLENQIEESFNVHDLKLLLINKFDEYFNYW